MQNNLVWCTQTHKIIQGMNFTALFTFKIGKISYVTIV